MALQSPVGAGQGVAGLPIVIKAPARPAVGVVAGRAIGPQAPGVVQILVAAGAGPGGILEGRGLVGGPPGEGGGEAGQGQSRPGGGGRPRPAAAPLLLAVLPRGAALRAL